MNVSNETIRKKQSTIISIQNELKQKHQELDELKKIEKDKTNVYGTWMEDCLKAIENDNRFHRKPIGPIGRYIHCINPYWSYAVEKHLAAIMSAFICSDNHDEKILLEIFSKYSRDYRPMVSIRKYSEQAHNISGTLEQIKHANLLSIYEVLRIDNVTVECTLIDFRQVEATILVKDLQHAKSIQQSGVLRWPMVDKKVKQVVEAWTYDGSNVKLDKAFRIYTNDKQPAKYFKSNNTQSLSTEELEAEIKRLNDQINQMNLSIIEMKKIRQTTIDNFENMKRASTENKKKIKELNKVIDTLFIQLSEIIFIIGTRTNEFYDADCTSVFNG
jgi:chromosome segregation ATPase